MKKLSTKEQINNMSLYEEKIISKGKFFNAMAVKKMETGNMIAFVGRRGKMSEPEFVPNKPIEKKKQIVQKAKTVKK